MSIENQCVYFKRTIFLYKRNEIVVYELSRNIDKCKMFMSIFFDINMYSVKLVSNRKLNPLIFI